MIQLGLIGCGVIGERRAQNLPANSKITAVFDTNPERAQKLAQMTGAKIYSSAQELAEKGQVQGLIVAAINSVLVPTMQLAEKYGLPVLVEKPAARSLKELSSLQPKHPEKIKIGFNHRFHPAYFDILKEIEARPNDPVMFIRATYGNGARVGFDREWRSNVNLSGGGELLDQGVHVLDLATNILKDLEVKTSWVRTQYWDMPVDDNAWAILSTPTGQTFSMHVSSSEWKNDFRFEVYTRQTKYSWTGLGRSYGPEKLSIFRMKPEMGPPDIEEKQYPPEDSSWLLENQNFLDMIQGKTSAFGGYKDALRALHHVENIYQLSSNLQKNENFQHPVWWKE